MKWKQNSRKILIVILLLILCIFIIQLKNIQSVITITQGQNFIVTLNEDESLGFQNDINQIITLTVESGLFNSSTTNLWIYESGGAFSFTALNDSSVKVDFTITSVRVVGDQNNEMRPISSGETLTILQGNDVSILWDIPFNPWLPMGFILGMLGLTFITTSPCYFMYKVKNHDADTKTFFHTFVLVILGIAFFIAWLW